MRIPLTVSLQIILRYRFRCLCSQRPCVQVMYNPSTTFNKSFPFHATTLVSRYLTTVSKPVCDSAYGFSARGAGRMSGASLCTLKRISPVDSALESKL
jgi:hypothetical protein